MITKTLEEEFFDTLLPVVREELPREREPDGFARALTTIALAHDISAEEAAGWLRMRLAGKQFTVQSFMRWAQALEELKCELEDARSLRQCPGCGGALQTLGARPYCASCGEVDE